MLDHTATNWQRWNLTMALADSTGLGPGEGQQLDSPKRNVGVTAMSNHVFKMM